MVALLITNVGSLVIRIGFCWGFGVYYTITVIRNAQNSMGNYLGPYSSVVKALGEDMEGVRIP